MQMLWNEILPRIMQRMPLGSCLKSEERLVSNSKSGQMFSICFLYVLLNKYSDSFSWGTLFLMQIKMGSEEEIKHYINGRDDNIAVSYQNYGSEGKW